MVKVPLNSECPGDVGEVSQGHGSQLWDCAGGDHLQELTGRNVQPTEDYSTIRARNGFTLAFHHRSQELAFGGAIKGGGGGTGRGIIEESWLAR